MGVCEEAPPANTMHWVSTFFAIHFAKTNFYFPQIARKES
jgi:hypothetical protein